MEHEYDWKGRPTREINTDGTDKLFSYNGCGCAGGQVTTIEGELVPRDDYPNQLGRKVQKIYADILGRNYKTEVLNWAGGVYTTTTQTFDAADRVKLTRQYAGTETSSTFQDVTTTYDGHGRLKTRHYPIEDQNANTTYNYNVDDSVSSIIDPRGVTENHIFNSLGLLEQVSWMVPSGSIIPVTPTVTYTYNNLGSRTSMIDQTGTTSYLYDNLSRLTSETKNFTGSLPNAPLANNGYKIDYTYHQLSGGLKSITDPFGSTVNYTNDKLGRLQSVSGTPFGDNTTGNYADGIQYRAFGEVKQLNYKTDDNAQVSMEYDNRLRVSEHKVASNIATGGYLKKASFAYNADSTPSAMDNVIQPEFDRTFQYDSVGRLKTNSFGTTTTPSGQTVTPYHQDIEYDVFSNTTARSTEHWGAGSSFTRTYQNGRMQPLGNEVLNYNAAGNIVYSGLMPTNFQETAYDASGRKSNFKERWTTPISSIAYISERNTAQYFDGNGQTVKEVETYTRINETPQTFVTKTRYKIYSSVLGGELSEIEIDSYGERRTTKVYAGGAIIAEQRTFVNTPTDNKVVWVHADPVTGSKQETLKTGLASISIGNREELEPLGQRVRLQQAAEVDPNNQTTLIQTGRADFPEWQCQLPLENLPSHCSQLYLEYESNLDETWGEKNKKGNATSIAEQTVSAAPAPAQTIADSGMIMSFKRKTSATTKPTTECPAGTVAMKDAEGNVQCVATPNEQVRVDGKSEFSSTVESDASTVFRSTQVQTPYGKYPEIVVYSTPEQRTADRQANDNVHRQLQNAENKKLALCYQSALSGYNAGISQHNIATIGAKKVNPLSLFGAAYNFGAGFYTGYKSGFFTYSTTKTLSGRPNRPILTGFKEGGAKVLRFTGSVGVRVAGLGISGAGIVVEGADQAFGTESFLRDAVTECNNAHPNATGKIEPGWTTVGKGMLGFGFADKIRGYANQY
jgi:hypothetical protein